MLFFPAVAAAIYGAVIVLRVAKMALSSKEVIATFETKVHCINGQRWCANISYFEVDKKKSDLIANDGYFCTEDRTVETKVVGKQDTDGLLDLRYEFMIHINHSCSDTGNTKVATFRFPSVDGSGLINEHLFESEIYLDNMEGVRSLDDGYFLITDINEPVIVF